MNEMKRLKDYLEMLINNGYSDIILDEIIDTSSNSRQLNDIIEGELAYAGLIK